MSKSPYAMKTFEKFIEKHLVPSPFILNVLFLYFYDGCYGGFFLAIQAVVGEGMRSKEMVNGVCLTASSLSGAGFMDLQRVHKKMCRTDGCLPSMG